MQSSSGGKSARGKGLGQTKKPEKVSSEPRLRLKQLLPYLSIFVIAPIVTFVLGRYLDGITGLPEFPPFPLNLIGGFPVFFLGLSIGIKSTRELYRIGHGLPWGGLNGSSQSRRLVTNGVYAYCRNPMTLGYSMLPCGMGIMFRSPGMAILIPAMIIAVAVVYLKVWEEPDLERRFGRSYQEYKRRTPFLIPRPRARREDKLTDQNER